MNELRLIGNLTRDPELVDLPSGSTLAKLRVASTTKYKEKEETIYLTVKLFGNVVNDVTKYDVKKGRRVHITGRLVLEEWVDKEGNKKSELVLFASSVLLLDNRRLDDPKPSSKRKDSESYELATDRMEEMRFDPEYAQYEDACF